MADESPGQAIAKAYEKLKSADKERATGKPEVVEEVLPSLPAPQVAQSPALPMQNIMQNQGLPAPGQLIAPAPQAPNPVGGQVYAGGTPDGRLTSTPRQATADTLNILEKKKDLEGEQGDIESSTLGDQAAIHSAAAGEDINHTQDFNNLLGENQTQYEDDHRQRQNVYANFRKQAGGLSDPSKQYWKDQGAGSAILGGLAAFASGMGSGLLGHAGNPYLDHLNKQIDNNYQSHKQNIEDLYQASVEAGKIEDTAENHHRFRQNGRLISYGLDSEHIKHDLAAVQNGGASKVAKVMAGKGIAGLDQQGVEVRQGLAKTEALAGASDLAAKRARAKEIKDNYLKFIELHNKDMGDDESRVATLKDLQGQGYNASELAPLFGGVGIESDPRTGQFILPKSDPGVTESAHYDDDGKLVLPTKSANGKRIDPKELATMEKDATEKTATIDGKPVIFRRKEEAEAATAIPEAERLHDVMQKAWDAGDPGTYNQARSQFIEMAPKLLGYKRGPSEAQAGGIDKGNNDNQDRATIAGQLPEFHPTTVLGAPIGSALQGVLQRHPITNNSEIGIGINKLKGVRATLDAIKKDAANNATNATSGKGNKKEVDLDALTKSLGGK